MSQHVVQKDIVEDQRTMRRLAAVIGCFAVAATAMAVIIGVIAG